MRIARLFDAVHPSAGPYFAADRARVPDAAERARIAGYLDGGTVILSTTARDVDRVEPRRGRRVGMSFRTDGDWVWSDGLAYYVRVHGIAPDEDFYAHVRRHGYACPPAGESAVDRALDALYTAAERADPG